MSNCLHLAIPAGDLNKAKAVSMIVFAALSCGASCNASAVTLCVRPAILNAPAAPVVMEACKAESDDSEILVEIKCEA